MSLAKKFLIQRGPDNGGDVEYATYEEMEKDFAEARLHPADLKGAVEIRLNELLEPVRQIFQAPELVKLTQAAYPPPAKISKAAAAAAEDVVAPHRLDIRVGRIVEVSKHPEADALYVEKIDLGESLGPRTIVSGLVNFVPESEMLNRIVVVLCNLKPAKMRGIESAGMVLCASSEDPRQVEPLDAPEGSQPGDRVVVEGYETGDPDVVLNPKKKIWEKLQEDLRVNSSGAAQWQGNALVTQRGALTAKTMKNAPIK